MNKEHRGVTYRVLFNSPSQACRLASAAGACRFVWNAVLARHQEAFEIAFEGGEVRKGSVDLDEVVVEAAAGLPLSVESVLVNRQEFTKTANCWGVSNDRRGTNTNRIVLFRAAGAIDRGG